MNIKIEFDKFSSRLAIAISKSFIAKLTIITLYAAVGFTGFASISKRFELGVKEDFIKTIVGFLLAIALIGMGSALSRILIKRYFKPINKEMIRIQESSLYKNIQTHIDEILDKNISLPDNVELTKNLK